MKKKLLAFILCLAMLALTLAGCANPEPQQPQQPSGTSGAQSPATADAGTQNDATDDLPVIRYGIFGTMIKGALPIIADELGLDIEEGVDIQLVSTQASADALTSIITGKDELDVWGMQIMPTCNFIANGADLVIFGGNAAEGGAMIAAKGKGAEFKDLNNLKGKTILGIRGETGFITVIGLLQGLGFDMEKDVTIKWTDAPSVLEGVVKGEGDVGFLPIEYTYFDEAVNAEVVCPVGELAENYICCRLATSRTILEARRADFVNVIKASIRAYKVYREDPETTIRILAAFSGQTEEYIKKNVYESRIKFTPDPYSDAVGPFYEVLKNMDFVDDPDSAVDVYDHVDVSLYKQALDEIVAEYPNDPTYQELVQLFDRQNASAQ